MNRFSTQRIHAYPQRFLLRWAQVVQRSQYARMTSSRSQKRGARTEDTHCSPRLHAASIVALDHQVQTKKSYSRAIHSQKICHRIHIWSRRPLYIGGIALQVMQIRIIRVKNKIRISYRKETPQRLRSFRYNRQRNSAEGAYLRRTKVPPLLPNF